MQIRLFAAAVAAAALTACASGNGTIPPARDAASGTLVHTLPTRDALEAARSNGRAPMAGSGNLYSLGSVVQTNPKLYLVFWGSAWSGSGDPYGVAARLKSFYGVIGGSGWLNTVTQYRSRQLRQHLHGLLHRHQ